MTEWSRENITKVPAEILFRKGGTFLHFHLIFQGLDIVGVFMRKSEEWFFGIYHGGTRTGYLHFGDIPHEKHAVILEDLLPTDRNTLSEFISRNADRVDYHTSTTEAFRYIGELDEKKIIQKHKK